MQRKNERHTFIAANISREAFQDVGVRLTIEDDTLSYFVHAHDYNSYTSSAECTDGCKVIRKGKVESVTQMDVGERAG
jgi:hypothetical protein